MRIDEKTQRTALIVFLLAVLFAGIVAIGAFGAEKEREEHPQVIFRDDLEEIIIAELPYAASVQVSEYEGDLSVRISPNDTGITYFGDKIIDGVRAVDSVFQGEKIDLSILGDDITFLRQSFEDIYGVIVDSRSGESEVITLEKEKDICRPFPASAYHLAILTMPPEDASLYMDVMDKLILDWDIPENEVFQEIASNYGMSGEQLRAKIHELQDQYMLVDGEGAQVHGLPSISFEKSPNEIWEAFRSSDESTTDALLYKTAGYSVQIFRTGIAYADASPHICCFTNMSKGNMDAVLIVCEEFPNNFTEEKFQAACRTVLVEFGIEANIKEIFTKWGASDMNGVSIYHAGLMMGTYDGGFLAITPTDLSLDVWELLALSREAIAQLKPPSEE